MNQSFILRLWYERRELPNAIPQFRATVNAVLGGESHAFANENDLLTHIILLIQQMDYSPSKSLGLKRCALKIILKLLR